MAEPKTISQVPAGSETLGDSAQLFRTLFDAVPDALVVVNSDGGIVLTNRQTEAVFGYKGEELLGQSVEMLMPMRFRDVHRQHRSHYMDHPHTRPMGLGLQLVALHKKGHSLPVEISLSSVTVASELFVVAAVRDVSERKRLEEALNLNEERLRTALTHSPTTVVNQDTALRYTWVYNPPPLRAEAFLGRTDAELFSPETAAPLTRLKRRLLETGQDAREEVALTFGKTTRHYDLYIRPRRDVTGEVGGLTAAMTDITEAKETAEKLRRLNAGLEQRVVERTLELAAANDELAETSAQRGRLYQALLKAQESERARIARDLHDGVGQALTGISLMLDGAADPARLQNLKDLVGQTLQDVRQLSRALRPSLLDQIGLGSALKEYGREVAQRSGLGVNVVVHLPYRLHEDQDIALYRIVQEALTNIVRHARAKNVSVVLTGQAQTLQLIVEDDGVGFNPERVPRGHVGLASIRERVELLEGTFGIESAPETGTTLSVRLPRL